MFYVPFYLLLSLSYHATTAEWGLCHWLRSEPASVRVGRLFKGFSLTALLFDCLGVHSKVKIFFFPHEMCLNNITEVFSTEVFQSTLDFDQPSIKPRPKSDRASKISVQIEKPKAIYQTEQRSWCLFSNFWRVHPQSARPAETWPFSTFGRVSLLHCSLFLMSLFGMQKRKYNTAMCSLNSFCFKKSFNGIQSLLQRISCPQAVLTLVFHGCNV